MTGRIAEDAIRLVRERANLAEVVSDVVALKRRGRSATVASVASLAASTSFSATCLVAAYGAFRRSP